LTIERCAAMKKLVVLRGSALCVLLALIWGGISAQQHFKREAEIKAKLEEAIGRDAGYTETILKMETDSSHITYGEFFELCDKSVEQRTTLIVELRGLYPSVNNATKSKLIDFLNGENDAVRTKRDLYRKQMLLSSAVDTVTEAVRDTPSSEYGWDFYRERVYKSKLEVVKAASDLESSSTDFIDSYQKALKLEGTVAKAAGNAGIRFKASFKEFDGSNTDKGKQSADYASQVLTQMAQRSRRS
jgi:hypothetical protein